MDKASLFVQVANMEERLGELYMELGSLKEKILQLIEENQRLQQENSRLLQQLQEDEPMGDSQSHHNLLRIYEEGFHVCHVNYGSLRTDGECLFCLSFLGKH
ncbi:initiation-control protein YabA [Alicyclobacillus tolerans]|uniref:Regulator of replication initiation timing n=2 Tax=Alicyclobacillus tolerans TaxID=90970 RepID=A0A1M6PJK2_9BACL|nr:MULTISPECIES: DNA replication initiation control protein YabA [Alicyclobacillus]MDP9729295.1 regulator of replication initiation timing [Alicyclobacillus tengchongensis]QRF22330.1 DNA replication initiation control protein YabA [Alicyclobacillus sp. TC]SHK08107.1 Regulator of replication initiation timing [Alicyclobacillus montanus]